MKLLLIIFALGDPNYNPLHLRPSEYQTVNDMGETTNQLGYWANDRGYTDQQMMEENPEFIEEEIRQNKIKDDKALGTEAPLQGPRINRE